MKKNVKIIILMLIILSSIIFEITGATFNFGSSYAYVIKPLIWIFIGIITFMFFKNEKIVNNKYKKEVVFVVFITTLIYFLSYFVLGYIKGFAYNPYDDSFKGVLTNLWTFIPMIIVREYVRYYMINNCNQKHILRWTFFISLTFVITSINIYKLDNYFSSSLSVLEFFLQTFIPELLTSLYLTYISYFAGYNASILYAAFPQIILYILPILPDVDWATLSILNSIIPFFSYIYINNMINKMDKTLDRKQVKTVGLKGWFGMIAIVILMVCFGLGLFPVDPLVIASDSMAPKIRKGDIVIIKDTNVDDIKKGDVIRYRMDNYYVVHRVVLIEEDEDGNRTFITKGDNNDDIDLYPVKENQVAGVVKLDIPYMGYPTLILGELLNTNINDEVKVDLGRVE